MRRLSKISNSRSSGQTLVTMVVVVFLLSMMLLAVTELGDRSRRQWYLQTAADNAAHSGAVMMARELNLAAILNRALIGNQIAIAQWLGLTSWLAMITQLIKNISYVVGLFPPVFAAMATLRRIIQTSVRVVDYGLKALMVFHTGVIAAISKAQLVLNAGMVVETVKTVTEVIEDHDDSLEWSLFQGGSLAPFPSLWWRMTDTRSSRSRKESDAFKTLTLNSRDGFTRRRTYRWMDWGIVKLVKAGGSALQTPRSGRWNWNALDGLELQIDLWLSTSKLPIAWGARAQNNKYWGSRGRHKYYGEAFRHVKYAAPIAWTYMRQLRVRQLPFTYMALRGNRRFGEHAIVTVLNDTESQQHTYARAEVVFTRPQRVFPRTDRQVESGNLFNALWQPKLVPLSSVDKTRLTLTEAADAS